MSSPPGQTWFCDHNAGFPASDEVIACFVEVERSCPGNPASAHAPGRRARAILEEARTRIARAFDLTPDDILFTSGGTEAANMAVLGLGDPALPVCLSPAEHPAVFEPASVRGTSMLAVDASGAAVVDEPGTAVGLVCMVHAQSEVGTLQPVAEAAQLAAALRVPLVVDAAQTLGRADLGAVVATGAAVVLSPHKAFGLRGHGVLAGRDLAAHVRPLLRGGAQEHGLRPGTQSPALALANAIAIEYAVRHRAERAAKMRQARDEFVAALGRTGSAHRLLTPVANSVPNTVMVSFDSIDGRNLLPALDLAGVYASHGSACTTGAPTPPRVLAAMGLGEDAARASVRFSFVGDESAASMQRLGACVGDVVRRLQKKK